jgi:hypothetical protein
VAPVVTGARFELVLPGPLVTTAQRPAEQTAGRVQL